MSSAVFEEPVELEIGLIEAGDPTPESYPYPSLTPTDARVPRTFQGAVLENALLRATFVPALGGRLLSLIDKRNGRDLIHPAFPSPGSRRGATLLSGIELHLDGRERLNSLGPVSIAAEEPNDDRPAGLWLSEAVTGEGTSWHLHATLPDDRAELRLEARIFNRSDRDVWYSAGLMLPALQARWLGNAISVDGLAIVPEEVGWSAGLRDGRLVISRFAMPRLLAPRQLDTWFLSIVPTGLEAPDAVSRDGAMGIDRSIRIEATTPLLNHRLVIRSGDETLEAPVQIYPERPIDLDLPGNVDRAVVVDAASEILLSWQADLPSQAIEAQPESDYPRCPPLVPDTFDPGRRSFAFAELGRRAMAEGNFAEADRRLEQALLYNGEDHVSWWMKAAARRHAGESGESQELLNAHYLAPLEPLLRAEGFLAQAGQSDKGPSPFLKPLAEAPEALVEVAAILVGAGLYRDAARWLDEALRHADLFMLRYLLAFVYHQVGGMDIEVADQVARAGRSPLGPPFPWRPIEREAIVALEKRFPSDDRLRELIHHDFGGHPVAQ